MIQMIIGILFTIIDLGILIVTALAVVKMIPEEVESSRWKRILAWSIYGLATVLLPAYGRNDLLTMVVLAVGQILIARMLYFKNKLGNVCQLIYAVILGGTSYIALFAATMLYSLMQLEMQTYFLLNVALKDVFLVIGTAVLCGVMQRRIVRVNVLRIRGMIIVPVFSVVLLFLYVCGTEVFVMRYGYHWMIVFVVLLLIINLYCLYFWYDVAKNQELKHKLNLMQQQNDLTLQYYEDLEENYSRSRKIIHDIRNHLHIIEEKYRTDNDDYIENVHGMLNSLGMKYYTENKMLNIVLNDKLKGIPAEQVDCNLGGVGLEFISDMDITTIFANLLDNAVEARKQEKDFWIRIRAEQIQDFLVVKIVNPFTGTYKEGKSSKPGHEGIGLQNVKQTLAKYRGELEIQTENQEFSVILVMPGEKKGERS